MEKRLLPPSPPAVQTVMVQERYVLPTRRAARSQEDGVVSAGSTSPTSVQTECTSPQLAPEEQEEEMAITSSYWIVIKGESRDFCSP